MWSYLYEHQLDREYLAPMFTQDNRKNIVDVFKARPSRIDYLVRRWPTADKKHKYRLYLAILCGAPILECLEWGVKNDDFEYEVGVDEDLSDFEFEYLDAQGTAKFMTWQEYDVWLKEKKSMEKYYPAEKACEFPKGCGEVDLEVINKLNNWRYTNN